MSEESRGELRIETVNRDGFQEAVDVLSEAFFDYPVMRYVIGDVGEDYSRRLRHLVSFFTEARFTRKDLVLAVIEAGKMVAVASINLPREGPLEFSGGIDPLEPHRQKVWTDLGPEARVRYEEYGAAAASAPFPDPHYHLGMIGVRRDAAGKGHARRLLDYLHRLSADHPSSLGVSLATENPRNVSLYEHFGYSIVSHEKVGDMETWGFFRPDPSP
jgi:ribosomal protein S18 acetylase RimI-like enzyme